MMKPPHRVLHQRAIQIYAEVNIIMRFHEGRIRPNLIHNQPITVLVVNCDCSFGVAGRNPTAVVFRACCPG